jgi:hypothetical protein
VRQQRGHVRRIERRNRPGALAAGEPKADRRATPPVQVALAVLEDPAQLGVTARVAEHVTLDGGHLGQSFDSTGPISSAAAER